ncbi:MAG: LacI family DNA-binding transcriptional regulator [Gemmatimonadetes bacterium]|nr:LacI family DNA-binding transcriptional regulator [Gemmatimonadota bacterium]
MRKKRVTIKDIAKTLGISHTTVSRALSRNKSHMVSEDTRRRVERVAEEFSYRPNLLAKGFATGKTGTLGLLTGESYQEQAGTQIESFLRAADERNFRLLVGMSAEWDSSSPETGQAVQMEQFISSGIDGLLVQTMGDEEESERILATVEDRVPVVTFHHPARGFPGVVLDFAAGFHRATEHLIALGHRRIGFLGENWEGAGHDTARGTGYFKAMTEHGLHPVCLPVGRQQTESGYRLSREVKDRFTALLCCSDYTAIGVYRGLDELGILVPDDVAIVGSGDSDVSAFVTPALTTQSTPSRGIARAAMELMVKILEGREVGCQIVLASNLIVRESCGSGAVDPTTMPW